MISHFRIACGAAAVLSLTLIVALGRSSPPAPVRLVPVIPSWMGASFDEAWQDTMGRLAMMAARPRVVKTETIRLEEPKEEKTEPKKTEPKKLPQAAPKKETNVCTRKGLRKVMVGRYKWRCKK